MESTATRTTPAADTAAPAAEAGGEKHARRVAGVMLGALPVVLAWIVYRDLPNVYFFLDDFYHLLTIETDGFARFVPSIFGSHLYVVRNLIFWALYRLAGLDPSPYQTLALVTHLFNTWLVYRVARRLLDGDAALACLAAALWGAGPVPAGAIGWYSVYGHVLVATIMLIVLHRILDAGAVPSARQMAVWGLLMFTATMCFGVGIGVAMAMPAVLVLLRPALKDDLNVCAALSVYPAVIAAFYIGYRRIYWAFVPIPTAEMMTVEGALPHWGDISAMFGHLVAFGVTSVVGGFAFDVVHYPGTLSAWAVPVYAAGVAVAAAIGGAVTRRRLLALATLSAATYAMIALGRGNTYIAFGFRQAWAAGAARYHYVGSVPLALGAALVIQALTRRRRGASAIVALVWLAIATSVYLQSRWHVDEHPEARAAVADMASRIDAAADATPRDADVLMRNDDPAVARLGFPDGMTFPGLAGVFLLLHPDGVVHGRQVRFVERRPGVYARHQSGDPRIARLLVRPEDVAPPPRAPGEAPGPGGAP